VTDFQFDSPFARTWSAPQVCFSQEVAFLDLLDMRFAVFDTFVQYVVQIAEVTMRGSPKQG
jgi:hypothetical protein